MYYHFIAEFKRSQWGFFWSVCELKSGRPPRSRRVTRPPGARLLTWFKYACQKLPLSCRQAADSLSIFQTGRVAIQRETETRQVALPPVEPKVWQLPAGYLCVTGQTSAGRDRAEDGVCRNLQVESHACYGTTTLLIYISKIWILNPH